ncbi:MAG TPA: hypothetical protein ENJ01_10250 [Gammaproteobacteria bacterium]|nr:hypothetical protein [Gammaproteobacteria bacterium]
MTFNRSRLLVWLTGLVLALSASMASAAKPGDSFVEKKIVLQISDPNPFKQTLVLNVASNLIKAYGQDQVAVEIVAFGPGLRLLFAENANAGRIKALAGAGVKFAACGNTIKKMTALRDGEAPHMNPNAVRVGAGVVRILELIDQGYVLVKP